MSINKPLVEYYHSAKLAHLETYWYICHQPIVNRKNYINNNLDIMKLQLSCVESTFTAKAQN